MSLSANISSRIDFVVVEPIDFAWASGNAIHLPRYGLRTASWPSVLTSSGLSWR